jgi:hypothetical protein
MHYPKADIDILSVKRGARGDAVGYGTVNCPPSLYLAQSDCLAADRQGQGTLDSH